MEQDLQCELTLWYSDMLNHARNVQEIWDAIQQLQVLSEYRSAMLTEEFESFGKLQACTCKERGYSHSYDCYRGDCEKRRQNERSGKTRVDVTVIEDRGGRGGEYCYKVLVVDQSGCWDRTEK